MKAFKIETEGEEFFVFGQTQEDAEKLLREEGFEEEFSIVELNEEDMSEITITENEDLDLPQMTMFEYFKINDGNDEIVASSIED